LTRIDPESPGRSMKVVSIWSLNKRVPPGYPLTRTEAVAEITVPVVWLVVLPHFRTDIPGVAAHGLGWIAPKQRVPGLAY